MGLLLRNIIILRSDKYMLYSEWLDQDLVARIQNKSPPIIFSLAFLGFGGNLSQLFFVKIPSIILRPDKYNTNIIRVFGNFNRSLWLHFDLGNFSLIQLLSLLVWVKTQPKLCITSFPIPYNNTYFTFSTP